MLKRTIAIFLILIIAATNTVVLAYTFPEPDWGTLYREKQRMVQETDFDLYTKAPTDSAPYYGEKFEPRGGAYIGSIAETAQNLLPIGSYLTYIDDMNQSDIYYPANKMIQEDNVIPMIGWTIHDMKNVDYNQVRKTLDVLNQYNKPMLIRFANEMNCSNLGDEPDLYIEIFRRVADMIHEYSNFGVVWSPIDLGALDRPFEYFYPGDEYVDWVGVSCYAIKYFQGNKNTAYKDTVYFMTGDYAWATNRIKPFMDFLKKNNINKPVMISEGGVATSNIFGEDLQSWATPRLKNMLWYLVMKYPQIKMINYFDINRQSERERFDISNYPYAIDIFNEAKESGAYIAEYGKNADFVFNQVESAGTLESNSGIIPLYTLAYIENQPEITVNYHIDGDWYHSASSIPYTCNLDISGIADGRHTFKISSLNVSKEYTFYKKGKFIDFGNEPEVNESDDIKVILNGNMIDFDQPPVLESGRTLVPLRAIFEALGATVDWNPETHTVTSVKGDIEISLTIGSNTIFVNDSKIELDVPAKLYGSRTLVPVRAVAEGFNCKVEWDDANQSVVITK